MNHEPGCLGCYPSFRFPRRATSRPCARVRCEPNPVRMRYGGATLRKVRRFCSFSESVRHPTAPTSSLFVLSGINILLPFVWVSTPSNLSSMRPRQVGLGVGGSGLGVQGAGCRVQGSGLGVGRWAFRVQGCGFRVRGWALGVGCSGCRMQGSGFGVQGSGLGVQGSGFRVDPKPKPQTLHPDQVAVKFKCLLIEEDTLTTGGTSLIRNRPPLGLL